MGDGRRERRGQTLSGDLYGILDRATGGSASHGTLSSSLPPVEFRALEQGRFSPLEGDPTEFAVAIALNPQPEPPSRPAHPPNPCLVVSTRRSGT